MGGNFVSRGSWLAMVLAFGAAALLVGARAQPVPSSKGTWTKLAPMLHPQNEAVVAVLGSRIYVMGGFAPGIDGPVDRVQVYDTAENEWSGRTPLPYPVHHHGAAVIGGKISLQSGNQQVAKIRPDAGSAPFDRRRRNRRSHLCAGRRDHPRRRQSHRLSGCLHT
jgi:hypothetical protein